MQEVRGIALPPREPFARGETTSQPRRGCCVLTSIPGPNTPLIMVNKGELDTFPQTRHEGFYSPPRALSPGGRAPRVTAGAGYHGRFRVERGPGSMTGMASTPDVDLLSIPTSPGGAHIMAARLGAKHHNAKLKVAGVRAARKSHAAGRKTIQQLADHYGVNYHTMWNVIHRVTWKHVP